jgi:lipoate-protein ligase A
MPDSGVLRVIDFGQVTPLRSQTLWHAVGYGVSAGEPPTLSFARPSAPYVCLGYHRDLAEIDDDYCRAHDLPVYRRMVGGGPVYLDQRQLFFQICVPAGDVSPSRRDALADLLAPVVAAFEAVGIPARLDSAGEICLGDAKICGHGAGQIENAVVVCGNLIEEFDHDRAAAILALPDPAQRAQTAALMRRYVAATPADPGAFAAALTGACAAALGREPQPGHLSAAELAAVTELDELFTSADWLAGPARTSGRPVVPGARPGGAGRAGTGAAGGASGRGVKVRAGVWTFAASSGGARIAASVIGGRIEQASLTAPAMNGQVGAAERALVGLPVAGAADALRQFGEPGRQLAAALAGAEGRVL